MAVIPAVVGSLAASTDNGNSTEAAGEGACCQSAGTAGGAGAGAGAGLDGALVDVALVDVAAVGSAVDDGCGVATAPAAAVPPVSSDVDAYQATPPTAAATTANTITRTMRSARWPCTPTVIASPPQTHLTLARLR